MAAPEQGLTPAFHSLTPDYIHHIPTTSNTYLNFRVSVIIPTLNEAKNLPFVLPRIPEWIYEVIIVDGYSTDNTCDIAKKLHPAVRVVLQEGKGKGAALRSGFAAARGDIIVMLDADGSTDPGEIPVFVGALVAGADFVKGSRFAQGGGTSDMAVIRRLGNWGLTQVVRILFGGKFSDLCYGYNAFWSDIVPYLALDGDGFEIETMMNVRALASKVKVAEVPSFEYRRIHGESNLKAFPDGWRVLKTILREWVRVFKGQRLTDDTIFESHTPVAGKNASGEKLPGAKLPG